MVIERSGTDIVSRVQTALKELLIRAFEIIQLYLDLSDSSTASLTGAPEDLGFFSPISCRKGLPVETG